MGENTGALRIFDELGEPRKIRSRPPRVWWILLSVSVILGSLFGLAYLAYLLLPSLAVDAGTLPSDSGFFRLFVLAFWPLAGIYGALSGLIAGVVVLGLRSIALRISLSIKSELLGTTFGAVLSTAAIAWILFRGSTLSFEKVTLFGIFGLVAAGLLCCIVLLYRRAMARRAG